MNLKKAYTKLDNHCCYNSPRVEFVKNEPDFPKDEYEVIDCLETIESGIKKNTKLRRENRDLKDELKQKQNYLEFLKKELAKKNEILKILSKNAKYYYNEIDITLRDKCNGEDYELIEEWIRNGC